MSNRKKIFHKPDEKVPSADDILNYLNEESSTDKSAPGGGMMSDMRKKMSKSEISKDEIEEEQDLKRLSPAPSMESSSIPKSVGGRGNKNNKKKHELEKAMLSEPLISDAVEGYNLLAKEKARHLIDEINQSISNQTQKKNNGAVVMRIAAILLVIFMISGGSFYLFNSFSSNEMADVSNEKKSPVSNTAINSDTIQVANKDSVHQLAIESESMAGEIAKEELKVLNNNKPAATDGYIASEEISVGPVLMDEDSKLSKQEANGAGRAIKADEKYSTDIPTLMPGMSQMQTDTAQYPKKDQLAGNYDKKELREDEYFDLQNISSQKSKSGDKKAKRKGNSYSMPSSTQTLDDNLSEAGRKGYSLEDGISLYNQNKFKEAGEIFTGVLQSQPYNQEAIYYNGMSDYQLKLYDKSLVNLSKVVPSSRHYDEARWYRALIYIASGQKEEAKKLLKELSKPGNSYSDKAIEELKKID
jgi:hypothetical protein